MLEKIIREGLTRGFQTVEVYSEKNRSSIYEDFTDYHAQHHQKNNHAVVRAFKDRGEPVGFKISDPFPSFESFQDAFFRVYTVDHPADREPNAAGLLPESVRNIKIRIHDPGYPRRGEEFFKDLRELAFETVLKYPRLNLNKISFKKTEKKIYLFNSRGLRAKYKKTLFHLTLNLNCRRKSISLAEVKTHCDLLSLEKMILRGHRLLTSLTDKPAPFSSHCNFIFTPHASITLLRTFSPWFKVGTPHQIRNIPFPSTLSILDNPYLDHEPGSVPFDDEGIQHEAKFLIQKGRPANKIANLTDGLYRQIPSTGNGFRSNGLIFPQTTFTNLYINPTTLPLKHLLDSSHRGLFVTTLKPVYLRDGHYYFLAFGYVYHKGELKEPAHFTLKTSLNSYLLSILKISRGLTFRHEGFNVGSPYILSRGEFLSRNFFGV